MSEMLERVARAMYAEYVREVIAWAGIWKTDEDKSAATQRLLSPGKYYDDQIKSRLPQARAAVEAMREPDIKMLNAACSAMSPGKRPTPDRVSVKSKHAIRYRAMIQEALK